jgi:hypothetical protein
VDVDYTAEMMNPLSHAAMTKARPGTVPRWIETDAIIRNRKLQPTV